MHDAGDMLVDVPDGDLGNRTSSSTRTVDLPAEVRSFIFSFVNNVMSRCALAQVSKAWRDNSMLDDALPRYRAFDLEGLPGSPGTHLVRLLDDPRVRSLGKERALELIGEGNKDRLCEYACVQRNFEVLKWARNELDLPWALYPLGPVSDEVLVLQVLRQTWPGFKLYYEDGDTQSDHNEGHFYMPPKEDEGDYDHVNWVTVENDRVVELSLSEWFKFQVPGPVPVEVWQFTSLTRLDLARIKLTSVPAEIGQLTLLEVLTLDRNQLTSLPAEIGQLTSLRELDLSDNQLTSLPVEIGQLTSLTWLDVSGNELTSLPAEIRELRAAGCEVIGYYDD